jgi:hypothetical protein
MGVTNGELILLEAKTLSDGSMVYNIGLYWLTERLITIECTSREKAQELFVWLDNPANVIGIEPLRG